MILLCGGTGALGGLVARHLVASGNSVRALVRQTTDASALERQGVEVVRGDLRDPTSLPPALAGVQTVVSTASAAGRALAGEKGLSIHDVDEVGAIALVGAAEAAGVRRFVYLSGGADAFRVRTPLSDAKRATERRLAESPMAVVIVRPDVFVDIWLSPVGGFDPAAGSIRVYGQGRAHLRFVAMDDVAAAVARAAVMASPPPELVLGGPESMSMMEIAERLQSLTNRPVKVSHVPRIALRAGARILRGMRPALASLMGMALSVDLMDSTLDDSGFRLLGVAPRPVSAYLAGLASSRT